MSSSTASRVAGSASSSPLQDLVLRVLQLQAVRRQLELAEQDDALMRVEDVVEERLVEPDRAERSGRVADEHLEDLEARAARRPEAAADDLADDRRRDAGPQRRNRLEVAAVFVADGKAVEQIFDRAAGRRAAGRRRARADALQVLKCRRKVVHAALSMQPTSLQR